MMRRRWLLGAAIALLFTAAGCNFDLEVAEDVVITCETSAECPEDGWVCSSVLGRCVPPKAENDAAPGIDPRSPAEISQPVPVSGLYFVTTPSSARSE